MTPEREAELRQKLREAMADCPACGEEEAEYVPTDELLRWLKSHGIKEEE